MVKTYSADSSPEELSELMEMVKFTASFLNDNPKAKALMEDPKTEELSEEAFIAQLMSIALEADANANEGSKDI